MTRVLESVQVLWSHNVQITEQTAQGLKHGTLKDDYLVSYYKL